MDRQIEVYKGKSVLVTGGAGFIGSNLVHRLCALGARVTVIDSYEPLCGASDANLEDVIATCRLLRLDIGSVSEQLDSLEVDYVFNLAGSVSHSDSITQPVRDTQLNYLAQLKFLEACRSVRLRAPIVYASTRQLYGKPRYLPVDEAHPVAPVDVNGINKFAAEQLHLLFGQIHGLRTVCLRLTNTYGPRQMIRNARQGVLGWFINRAVTGAAIELFDGGEQLRDLNYVDDVVDAFLIAGETEATYGRFLNLSGPAVTLKAFAEKAVSISGEGSIKAVTFPPDKKQIDIGDYYGSSREFEMLTGWAPRRGLEEGITRTIAFYRRHWNDYR